MKKGKEINLENEEPCCSCKCSEPVNIVGWNNEYEVAQSVWSASHDILLNGDLFFAYRNRDNKSSIKQLIIVKNFDTANVGTRFEKVYTDFAIGVITDSYSYILPHVKEEYIKNDVLQDMSESKIDKKIIDNYKNILNTL